MKSKLLIFALAITFGLMACSEQPAPPPAAQPMKPADAAPTLIPVNEENYKVAESDLTFHNITKLVGMNTFFHFPIGAFDLNNQTVVRMNQDTVYSGAVIDASEGATITIPEMGDRYLSVMVVQNDHYIDQVFLEPGTYDIESETEFALIAMRIRFDANDPEDAARVTALRDGTVLSIAGNGVHTLPDYDLQQLEALRDQLADESLTHPSTIGMQGARGSVDPRMHLLGTAYGWGLLPEANAIYIGSQKLPADSCYTASFQPPPFNPPGFFSITMYDEGGWIVNERAILNEFNIEFNENGSFDAFFGDCGDDAVNNLPITDGWNFVMRIYEPKVDEVAKYRLPDAQRVN
jgi:hypothetical protein